MPLLRAKPYEAAAAISGDIRCHGEQKLINASKTYCERLIIRGTTATKANFLETVCMEARKVIFRGLLNRKTFRFNVPRNIKALTHPVGSE